MLATPQYRSHYTSSHALVIGVNSYQHVSPLRFAAADANAVADALVELFGFPRANIALLLDDSATKAAILNAFFSYRHALGLDDRIVVFFAGHGHTVSSRRGEIGYLVPHDGQPDNLASLIRWQELTQGADLIDAKHVLFLMDACYGGLAVTRAPGPGSMRFLRDMLFRPARQVLTAGKGDETVADLGGPLAGHSPFTGHLLQALSGKAAFGDGIITANGVMAHVYQAVGQDAGSKQTPHYGLLDGDGDFIFSAPFLVPENGGGDDASTKDNDILIPVPVISLEGVSSMNRSCVDETKEYLSDERSRLRLHDTLAAETRRVIQRMSSRELDVTAPWSEEEFRRRVVTFDSIVGDLCSMEALVSHWATAQTRPLVSLAPRRLCDQQSVRPGSSGWLGLAWYPILLLTYSAGIAAVAANRFDSLRELFDARVSGRSGKEESIVVATSLALDDANFFKLLPGLERRHTPRSDHLHKLLQPMCDDLFFLGSDYDRAFDRFEILLAMEYMHRAERHWGPVGRFGWKGEDDRNPVTQIRKDVERQGIGWEPIQAGLFGSSLDRANEILGRLQVLTGKLQWF